MAQDVLVLNADWSIQGTVHWHDAARLVYQKKAEIIYDAGKMVHPSMPWPKVIRLVKAVRALYKNGIQWSKTNVHIRDKYVCQYCGDKMHKRDATVDHIVPQDRLKAAGKNPDTFENTVSSCFDCNNKKQNRTPKEARMSLKNPRAPITPTIMEFFIAKAQVEGLGQIIDEDDGPGILVRLGVLLDKRL